MKKYLMVVAAGLFAANVFAAEPYVQLQAGQAKIDEDIQDDSDTYFDVGVGFKANKNLAFEISYKNFGEFSDSGYDEYGDYAKLTAKASAFTVAAVGILPLGPSVELLGKIGADVWKVKYKLEESAYNDSETDNEDGTNLFLALGVAFNITETTDIHLEYQRHKIDDSDVDVLAVGANFGF